MAYIYNENNIGESDSLEKSVFEFKEKEYGKYFTYRKLTPDSFLWDYSQEKGLDDQGYTHEVDVNDICGQNTRLAKILKTVVYVVIDEDEYGNPVIEVWKIKRNEYIVNC